MVWRKFAFTASVARTEAKCDFLAKSQILSTDTKPRFADHLSSSKQNQWPYQNRASLLISISTENLKIIKKWPPYPPKREFNPPKKEIFLRVWYRNLIGLGLFIRLSYNPSWWEKSAYLELGAPRGVKVGVIGGSWGSKIKYGSKCLKLPNSSRKVVFSILKIFPLICKILRKISTLKIFLSIFHFGWKCSKWLLWFSPLKL